MVGPRQCAGRWSGVRTVLSRFTAVVDGDASGFVCDDRLWSAAVSRQQVNGIFVFERRAGSRIRRPDRFGDHCHQMFPYRAEMTATRPIGVAIAGLGFGDAVHRPALAANPGLEAVALWHPRQERLDQVCAESGLKGYTDWDALLADESVEAVIIATPPAPRHHLALRALQAGKHLLLEKPVALDAQQVANLQREAISRRPAWLSSPNTGLSSFNRLSPPQNRAVGELWLVKMDWLMSRANPNRAWSWYSRRTGGASLERWVPMPSTPWPGLWARFNSFSP